MRTDIAADEIMLHHDALIGRRDTARERKANALAAPAGNFVIRPLDAARDAPTLHRWFAEPRAAFWNMQDKRVDEVAAFYQAIADSAHADAWLGLDANGASVFLFESYDPAREEVGEHYAVRPGDLGMHLFVGPAATPLPGYTREVFRALMTFLFDRLDAERVVVEPDARNARIHALNRAMGFAYTKTVAFREKSAALAFCTRADFHAATARTQTGISMLPNRNFKKDC